MKQLPQKLKGLIEAACIAVVAFVPLVFNPLSMERFERDKQVVFRSLALLILAAWTTLMLLEYPRRQKPVVTRLLAPVAASLAALLLAVLLAAWFSVNPTVSLWGSYESLQGTYTFFCGLVVAAAAAHLRDAEQRERLLTLSSVAGFPVALYAILQAARGDPFGSTVFSLGGVVRTQSTIGNPIYLGGYLVMIVPIGCRRILELAHLLRLKEAAGRSMRLFIFAWQVVIVGTQIVALFLTVSRGPFLGLLVALFSLFILLAIHRGRRRAAIGIACMGALALAGLLRWGSARAPSRENDSTTIAGRLVSSLSATETSGRTERWAEAPRLMLSRDPFRFPDGHRDPFHALRPWFGYGAETLAGVLPQYFSNPGPVPALETRFHNLIWDTWASVGGAGILALLFVYSSLFFHAYRHLGWIRTRRRTAQYWISLPIFAAIGAFGFASWHGAAFSGLGLQAAFVAAIVLFPMATRPTSGAADKCSCVDPQTGTLIVALLAGLAGHLAETAFAFETATTMALFWIYVGILMAATAGSDAPLSARDGAATVQARDKRSEMERRSRVSPPSILDKPALGSAMVAAMLLVPMLYAFISLYTEYPLSAQDVLGQMLLGIRGGRLVAFPVLLLILLSWVGTSLAVTAGWNQPSSGWPNARSFWSCLCASGLVATAYAVVKAGEIAAIGTFPRAGAPESLLLLECRGYEKSYVVWLLVVLGLVLLCGFLLRGRNSPEKNRVSAARAIGALVAAGAVAVAVVRSNVDLVRADIALRWATVTQARGVGPACAVVYNRAAMLAPGEAYFQAMLAQGLRNLAAAAPDQATFESRMKQSEEALLDERRISPLSRSDFVLGELYLDWALRSKDAQERNLLAQEGRRAFERARVFEPGFESAWSESGILELLLLDHVAGEKFQQMADSLVPVGSEGEFGLFYADRSREGDSPELRKMYAARAGLLLDLALRGGSADPERLFSWEIARGLSYQRMDHWDEALVSYVAASQVTGTRLAWQADVRAAEACWELNRRPEAIRHVQTAIARAPADEAQKLNQLLRGMLISH